MNILCSCSSHVICNIAEKLQQEKISNQLSKMKWLQQLLRKRVQFLRKHKVCAFSTPKFVVISKPSYIAERSRGEREVLGQGGREGGVGAGREGGVGAGWEGGVEYSPHTKLSVKGICIIIYSKDVCKFKFT